MDRQIKAGKGPVTVQVDPAGRRHRDRQQATPLKRRDERRIAVDAGTRQESIGKEDVKK